MEPGCVGVGAVIELPGDGVDGQVWRLFCLMANEFKGAWALIGTRMVELHGLAAGRQAPRRSADVDALCEAKAVGSRPRDLVAWLTARGAGPTPPRRQSAGP